MSDPTAGNKLVQLEARLAEVEALLQRLQGTRSPIEAKAELLSRARTAPAGSVHRAREGIRLPHVSPRQKRFGWIAVTTGALTLTAVAYAYEPQFTFIAGTPIRAAEVNKNFADVFAAANEVAGLAAAVDARTAGIASKDGNIGIGTTSPISKLNIITSGSSYDADVNPFPGIRLQPATAEDGAGINIAGRVDHENIIGRDPTTDDLVFKVDYGSAGDQTVERLRIKGNGNVGIGTTDAWSGLTVKADGGQIGVEGDQSAMHHKDGSGTLRFLTGLRSDISSVTDYVFWSYTGDWLFAGPGSGNVGIGTSDPGYKLHVEGSAYNTTGVWAIVSDSRLKTDVKAIQGALETVTNLEGVTFHWKDPKKDDEQGLQRGFIAQDVEKVIPEWVKTDPKGFKYLEKVGAEALLVEAIKELKAELDAVKASCSSRGH